MAKHLDNQKTESLNTSPEVIEPIIAKYALTESKYLDLLTGYFQPDWFDDHTLGKFIELAIKYRGKFNKIPNRETMEYMLSKVMKPEELSDNQAKLSNLYSLDMKFDAEYIDDQIVNYLKFRGMYHMVISNIDDFKKVNQIDKYIEELQKLSSMTFDDDLGFFYLRDIKKHLDYLTSPESSISTGYQSLDSLMNGGFPRDGKTLIVFVAQVHMGKSAFISNVAAKMLQQNMFPLIISLEMPEMVYAKRITAHLTDQNINLLKYNVDTIETRIKSIKDKYPQSELVIKEFPPSSINCNNLKTYIDKVISTYNRTPDAIFVDYLGLMNPSVGIKLDNLYLKGGNVAKALRSLSYHYERPIITAQQLNRGGFDTTDAGLDDIGESISIAADADVVFHLYQQDGDKEAEKLNLRVLKNRIGGRVGARKEYHFSGTSLAIEDADATTNPEQTDSIINAIVQQTSVTNVKDV